MNPDEANVSTTVMAIVRTGQVAALLQTGLLRCRIYLAQSLELCCSSKPSGRSHSRRRVHSPIGPFAVRIDPARVRMVFHAMRLLEAAAHEIARRRFRSRSPICRQMSKRAIHARQGRARM
jgi:hypothetical protein